MKKAIIAAAAFAGSIIATGAFAQVGTFVDSYDVSATGAVAGSTGAWNVKLYKLNGVSGKAATQYRIAFVHAPSFPGGPNDNVTKIQVEFFSYLGTPGPGTIPLLNGAGGILGTSGISTTTSHIPNNPANGTLWTNTNVKYNGSSQLFNAAQFSTTAPTTSYELKRGGGNAFLQNNTTGSINLKYRAFSVKITLLNTAGTKIWSGTQDLAAVNAPEGSSLALLAAGLVPLGLVARRRLRSRG